MGRNIYPQAAAASSVIDHRVALSATTTSTVLDLTSGGVSVFEVLIGSTTSFTFTNAPAGTDVFSFTLITNNDGTAGRAMSFSNTIRWAGGYLPPRTTAASATDVWTFFTRDGGATWVGSLAINDAK